MDGLVANTRTALLEDLGIFNKRPTFTRLVHLQNVFFNLVFFVVKKAKLSRQFTATSLAQFDGRDGRPLLLCLNGVVYDVSNFHHPGGLANLQRAAGLSEAIQLFNSVHPYINFRMALRGREVGVLSRGPREISEEKSRETEGKPAAPSARLEEIFREIAREIRLGKDPELASVDGGDWGKVASMVDRFGNSLLHVAAQNNNKRFAEEVLKVAPEGIRSLQNKNGKAPAKCARDYGYTELADFLDSAEEKR